MATVQGVTMAGCLPFASVHAALELAICWLMAAFGEELRVSSLLFFAPSALFLEACGLQVTQCCF